MKEQAGWRQGHWEAEESGEKKLRKQVKVRSRWYLEAGKVNESRREQISGKDDYPRIF